jgi:hypothetical protein
MQGHGFDVQDDRTLWARKLEAMNDRSTRLPRI